ncbi:unnamed protein product [Caenorhabditis brenneri]
MKSKYFIVTLFLGNFVVQYSATEEADTTLSDNPETCEKWKPIKDEEFGQGRIEYIDEWKIGRVQCIPNTRTECTSVEIRGKQENGKVVTIKKTDGGIATVYIACKPSKNETSITEVSCIFQCKPMNVRNATNISGPSPTANTR